MIGPISATVSNHQGMDISGPGKKAVSVGHLAKAAVAAAREAGADVPKNAQGMAASAIARGIDPASLFSALVGMSPTTGDSADVDVAPDVEGSDGADTANGSTPTDAPDIVPVSEDPEAAMLVNSQDAGDDKADAMPLSELSELSASIQPTAPDPSEIVEVLDSFEATLAILSDGSEENEIAT